MWSKALLHVISVNICAQIYYSYWILIGLSLELQQRTFSRVEYVHVVWAGLKSKSLILKV